MKTMAKTGRLTPRVLARMLISMGETLLLG
jgi:hypothetical protein